MMTYIEAKILKTLSLFSLTQKIVNFMQKKKKDWDEKLNAAVLQGCVRSVGPTYHL